MPRLPPDEENRVLAELQAVITECNDRDARLQADRIHSLSAIAVARAALIAYEQAVQVAQSAQAGAEQAAERARVDAIELAARTEFEELTAADQARQDVNLPIERAHQDAYAAAEDTYSATLREIHAAGGTFVEQDAAERRARAAREASRAKADAVRVAAIRDADRTWETATEDARRKRIQSHDAAEQQRERQRVLNQRALEDAVNAAGATFAAALRVDQPSMAVETQFAKNRAQLQADCEARKQVLMARLGGG